MGLRWVLAIVLVLGAVVPAQASASARGPLSLGAAVASGTGGQVTVSGRLGEQPASARPRRTWRIELQRRGGEHWTWSTVATTGLKAPYRRFALKWTAPAGRASLIVRVRVRAGHRVLATTKPRIVRLNGSGAPTSGSAVAEVPETALGSTIFSDGFESGDFSAWTQVATGADGKAAVQSQRVGSGKLAAQLSATSKAGSRAYIRKIFASEQPDLFASGDFQVVTGGAAGALVPLLRLLDATSAPLVSLYRRSATNGIQVSYGGKNYSTAGRLALKKMASLSLHVTVNGASSTVVVRLNGALVYATSSASLGAAGVTTIQIGNDAAGKTSSIVADTIVVKNATAGPATTPAPGPTSSSPTIPINTAVPTIAGTPQTGQKLTANPGTWTGAQPITFAYAWQRCKAGACAPIGGATASTYTVISADEGATLGVAVTATNPGGTATATSGPTTFVVPPATPPANTTPPTISGTARDGQLLTATPGTWTGTQPITYAYAWTRCTKTGTGCVAIAGATGATYIVTPADVGRTLKVGVAASNSAGTATATSKATATVTASTGLPGLVAQWHMDETSGSTMVDSSGRGHNGTLHGVQLGQPGFAGLAYRFSGSSYVLVPDAPDLNPGAANLTLTARIKATAAPASPDWDLMRKGLYVTVGGEYKMEYQPGGYTSCGFLGSGGYSELQAGPPVNDGAWHTIQCIKTASAITLVVDGASYSQSASIGTIANNDAVPIGARPDSEFFQGDMDEASIQVG